MSEERITPDLIWQRIAAHEREFFKSHRDRWFTYRIEGEELVPSHSDVRIPRGDFDLALALLPMRIPTKLSRHVTDYEYVWAILNDERISQGAW
ncbi:MAG: hypothetical protein JRG76_02315 [Deltaproteobacteria bacterium]|nr:hypothetical protein [Deltaproteobacteria bacterium]MBW2413321.1 hypothetical protein [Deltaproteobacteria bacterium]